jgi:D-amino-acid dehydrogenase
MEQYGQTLARLERFGIEAKAYRGAALTEFEPALREDLYGGWHHPHDSHLRPDVFVREWKKKLVCNGVQFEENCVFQRFGSSRPGAVQLQTDRGIFTAAACVIAAGAWTPELIHGLPIRLPMQPGKGYSITVGKWEGFPQIPCMFEERSVVATPFADGCRIGGTMEFSGRNRRLVKKRIENLKQAAGEYLKNPPTDPVAEEWVGLRPMMSDDLPVIDRMPHRAELYVATGHGMMGMSLAPATGRIIADLINGRNPQIDISPFGLQRFR